jgi:hypothetical protein
MGLFINNGCGLVLDCGKVGEVIAGGKRNWQTRPFLEEEAMEAPCSWCSDEMRPPAKINKGFNKGLQ